MKKVINPEGPKVASYRVLRGGAWFNDPQYLRAANRNGNYPSNPGYRSDAFGFRLVRTKLPSVLLPSYAKENKAERGVKPAKPGFKILDLSAGNRAIWFNKNHPLCIYLDKRAEVNPMIVCDTRKIPNEVGENFTFNKRWS